MATSLYAEQEADFRFKGDYVDIDGTLNVDGASTLAGGVTLTGTITNTNGTFVGGTISGVTLTGTITSSGASLTTLKLSSAPSGTDAGLAWTSSAPVFSDAQMYILCTAGSTAYRIPIWLDA